MLISLDDEHHRQVVFCTFLIVCRHPTKLLEPIDEALHPIAFSISSTVKWLSALLIGAMSNGGLDAVALEVLANLATAIAFISDHLLRTQLGTTSLLASDSSPFHHLLKHRGFITLSSVLPLADAVLY